MMFLEQKFTLDDLITRCKANERKAQELLYKQLASKMLGVCFRYATDRMEAEDMLQNGFIRVFQKIKDYRGDGSFEGWVRRIMVHSAIEYYRKHHKMMQVVELDEAANQTSVNPLATANLDAKDLMVLIQQLAPGYRIVFNLYAIEGYSHKEIAEIIGTTEGASKSQLSRARSILKDKILKWKEKNMAMQDKELDELFRSKLDDFEVVPSQKVWGTIDDELDSDKRKRILLPLLGIAASVIVLLCAGILFIPHGVKVNDKHPVKNDVAKIKTAAPVIAKATANTAPFISKTINNSIPVIAKANNTAAKQHLTAVAVKRVVHMPVAKQIELTTGQPGQQKVNEQPVIATTAPHEKLVAVVPDETTPLMVTQPAEAIEVITAKPVLATTTPANTKPIVAAVKPKRRIHTLGDIINLAMAKVDKRHDKLIEFTNTDDDDEANITGVNLGLLKIKKDK